MKTVLRSVFLTSEHPLTTAEFFSHVAGLPLEQVGSTGEYVYWRLDRNGMQLAIHDAAAFADYSHPALPGSNLTHLYFTIKDVQAFLTHLRGLGIEPYSVDDIVVTVVDPDGRKVMFGTA
jgi:hypothetical protein